jgi:hypothetical protein
VAYHLIWIKFKILTVAHRTLQDLFFSNPSAHFTLSPSARDTLAFPCCRDSNHEPCFAPLGAALLIPSALNTNALHNLILYFLQIYPNVTWPGGFSLPCSYNSSSFLPPWLLSSPLPAFGFVFLICVGFGYFHSIEEKRESSITYCTFLCVTCVRKACYVS